MPVVFVGRLLGENCLQFQLLQRIIGQNTRVYFVFAVLFLPSQPCADDCQSIVLLISEVLCITEP